MTIVSRTSKFLAMLRGSRPDLLRFHPFPWREHGVPYFLETPAVNPDGHGGYSRSYAFDAEGVPFTLRRGEAVYDPLVIARYGLKMRAVALACRDEKAADIARSMAPLLAQSGAKTGAWGRGRSPLEMGADVPRANVQGNVISALIRLHEGAVPGAVGDLLDRAVARLLAPIERGGTMRLLNDGPFLEEIPEQPMLYNIAGCVRGLYGLYDMADATGHGDAARAIPLIESTLAENMARFTTRLGWSLYGLSFYGHRYLCSSRYHDTNIAKIRLLAMRTGHPAFKRAVETWETARTRARSRLPTALAKAAQVVWLRDIRHLPLWGE